MTDPQPRRSARDRIFEAARELFYRRGIHGVGVETIAQAAGATKMSLYRAFPSKDALVAECLRASEQDFWAWWNEVVAPHERDSEAQLLALFDALATKTCSRDSRGCAIANAAVEIGDSEHPGRAVIVAHKRTVRARLRRLCAGLNTEAPNDLADSLMLLMEGANATRLAFRAHGPAASVGDAARRLVAVYQGRKPR
ncbi:TetR/AcrR family transcriptional regulator [Flagellatimonas centrodinii]|uniref:TetR/AcrR family transcriptional regulator n=1 Tax=Flagellatimonas centrodinii TaxID=2806210 RepID=UPI001FEEEE4E|nr:TetR/AcrR family transcriptional regulator [Flagellatimonas centrodinii]ULQ46534.1 TetR/AcrR family transcriptional regulator [Flagellatimonas centrodinii]